MTKLIKFFMIIILLCLCIVSLKIFTGLNTILTTIRSYVDVSDISPSNDLGMLNLYVNFFNIGLTLFVLIFSIGGFVVLYFFKDNHSEVNKCP